MAHFLYHFLVTLHEAMLLGSQVYCALKEDTHKGDFGQQTENIMKLIIDVDLSKHSQKKFIKEKVMNAALQHLVNENSTTEKNNKIKYIQQTRTQ